MRPGQGTLLYHRDTASKVRGRTTDLPPPIVADTDVRTSHRSPFCCGAADPRGTRCRATATAAYTSGKPGSVIGERVMDELRALDEVAYVRFASVYRSFQDVDAFRTEIEQLRRHRRRREPSKDQLPLLPGDAADDEKP